MNSLYNTIYPGHPLRGLAWCGIIYGLDIKGRDISYGVIEWLETCLKRHLAPENSRTGACIVFGCGSYIVLIQIRQYILRKLYSYHGWMYQEHGEKVPLNTKVWAGLVKLFIGRNPSLYSYQGLLPTLPLPSLDDTLRRYLRSIRPLCDDAEYYRMEVLAEDFRRTLGKKLQRYLWLKWLISTNYVSSIFEYLLVENFTFEC